MCIFALLRLFSPVNSSARGEKKSLRRSRALSIGMVCLIRKKIFPFIGFLCAGELYVYSNWIGVFARSSQALLGKNYAIMQKQ
jgi:hypothetical protein